MNTRRQEMRYYITKNEYNNPILIDKEGELEDIELNYKWFDCDKLCDHLNKQEQEKLEQRRKYNNLKFKIKKIAETI